VSTSWSNVLQHQLLEGEGDKYTFSISASQSLHAKDASLFSSPSKAPKEKKYLLQMITH